MGKRAGLTAAVVVLAGLGLYSVTVEEISTCVVGDVRDRQHGRVPTTDHEIHLDAARMGAGLGSAAIGAWEGLGDAVTAGGQLYVRTTHPSSSHFYTLLHNRYFQTNDFVYLPPGTRAAETWHIAADRSWLNIWTELSQRYPAGVILEGYVLMDALHSMAIARAPIDGVPIERHAAMYYTRPMDSARRVWAYVVAITADLARPSWWGDHPELSRAIPRRGDRRPDGRAHVLWLSQAPHNPAAAPPPASVRNVGELMASSVVAMGSLRLYPIRRIAECQAARAF